MSIPMRAGPALLPVVASAMFAVLLGCSPAQQAPPVCPPGGASSGAASASAAPAGSSTAAAQPPGEVAIPFELPRANELVVPPPMEPGPGAGGAPRPRAEARAPTLFVVEIDKTGGLRVNGAQVADADALLPLARAAKKEDPSVRALLNADSDATMGTVLRVMDRIKQAGIAKYAFGMRALAP